MKTIIVGAGINGLLLGAMLAKSGDCVEIYEKNKIIGGRGFLFEKEGYVSDYGIHLTRYGSRSAIAAVMKYIGHDIKFNKLGKSYVTGRDGNKILFPTSPGGIFSSTLFSFNEKIKLIILFLKIKRGKFDHGLMDVSLEKWMSDNNITGGIRKYLELISSSVMVCPFFDRCSSGEMLRNLKKTLQLGRSAEYPADGWRAMHEILVSEINKNGSINLSSSVDSVIIKNGKACGVTVKGKEHIADRIILNLPLQEVFSILPEDKFIPDFIGQCKNIESTAGVFLDVAIRGNVYDYDGLLYTYDPIAFGAVVSNLSDKVAPADGQLITIFYPTSHEDIEDKDKRTVKISELWNALKRYFPDIEEHIIWKRETAIKMVDGCEVNVNQTEDKRPGVKAPGVDELYFAGDSVAAPGAGGDVGNESVLIAFKQITGIEIS